MNLLSIYFEKCDLNNWQKSTKNGHFYQFSAHIGGKKSFSGTTYESIYIIYVYIFRCVTGKIAKNTEKWLLLRFFAHITRKKVFLGRMSCSDDHSSIFIIVAERITFRIRNHIFQNCCHF